MAASSQVDGLLVEATPADERSAVAAQAGDLDETHLAHD